MISFQSLLFIATAVNDKIAWLVAIMYIRSYSNSIICCQNVLIMPNKGCKKVQGKEETATKSSDINYVCKAKKSVNK